MRRTSRRAALLLAAAATPFVASCARAALYRRPLEPTIAERRAAPAPPSTAEPRAPAGRPAEPFEALPAEPARRPSIGDDVPRKLEFRGAPLSEALYMIASLAEVNLVLDSALDQPVDVSFPAVLLDDALQVLLDRNGLTMVEGPPGIFWIAGDDGDQLDSVQIPLQAVNAGDVLENLKALVPADTVLVVDTNQNFLVVRGRKRDVQAVEAYLATADRLKKQVLIEVEILEVILNDDFELGVQHLLTDPRFLGVAGVDAVQDLSTSGDGFTATLGFLNTDLTTTINALESYGVVNVVSSPRLLAVTNTEADIEVVREVPYIEVTTEITGDAGSVGTSSQESVAFKEAGIKLKVTPVVQAGDMVHLSVDQEFSEVIDFFLGIPVLDTRKIVTQFLVEGHGTAVLGGLIQDRQTETERGVPVLMHIPWLGRLFRSDQDTLEKRELLVLLTPRVLDAYEATALAGRYKQSYHERLEANGVSELQER